MYSSRWCPREYQQKDGCKPYPMFRLHELLTKYGQEAYYEHIKTEGYVHQPTFWFRVSFVDDNGQCHTSIGCGSTKRNAKHAAAETLLNKLSIVMHDGVCEFNSDPHNDGKSVQATDCGSCAKPMAGNPVTWLEQMCMYLYWPPPQYEFENIQPNPYTTLVTVCCKIKNFREVATARRKRVAKRLAASNMWARFSSQ